MRRAILFLLAACVVAGCGETEASVDSNVLVKAAVETKRQGTAHVLTKMGLTTARGRTESTGIGWERFSPLRSRLTLSIRTGGHDLVIEQIRDRAKQFLRFAPQPNYPGGTWMQPGRSSPGQVVLGTDYVWRDPDEQLIVAELSNHIRRVGLEQVSGVVTTHYRSQITWAKGFDEKVDTWIDEAGLIRRLQTQQRDVDGGFQVDATDYSAFGRQIPPITVPG